MVIAIHHSTSYTYYEPVSLCHNRAMLFPRNLPGQTIRSRQINIIPEPLVMDEYLDAFGNTVLYFAIQEEHKNLTVQIQTIVERSIPLLTENEAINALTWEDAVEAMNESNTPAQEARQFIPATPLTEANENLFEFMQSSFSPKKPLIAATRELTHQIFTHFKFTSGFTTITTPVSEVMASKKGVCQDFAHLAISALRMLGLAARYVSGYLETIPPPGQPKLMGVDASHAWFSVYVPNWGWMDFDPTNDLVPGLQHVTVGWGRDYTDVTPLKGVILSSGPHSLAVKVDVSRIE